ncbi:MAG: response regulator transcription factor [Balneolales bacterium]|nr:response regulator transcription factor [Balneolales bacterium]
MNKQTIRVSIVEDDERIRNMFIILFESAEGFRCVSAYSNAEDALSDLPIKRPDVVLMDINLPEMDGIECLRRLRGIISDIHVVMLTVYEDNDRIFESLEAGAVGYLLKSTSPDEIMESLRDANQGGAPMSAPIARKVVQSFRRVSPKDSKLGLLTVREQEILALLASGYIYKEIADQLFVSMDTVKTHIRNIYGKLQVRTKTEAVLKYLDK